MKAEQLLAKLQERDTNILDHEDRLNTAHIKEIEIFWTMKGTLEMLTSARIKSLPIFLTMIRFDIFIFAKRNFDFLQCP